MDVIATLAGVALPWLLGASVLLMLQSDRLRESGGVAWVLGCGWFAGSFLLTVWMRAVSRTGLEFGWLTLALPAALAAGALVAVAWRRDGASIGVAFRAAGRTLIHADDSAAGHRGRRWLWTGILLWMGI